MKYFCSFVGVKLFQFCWKCLVARKNGQKSRNRKDLTAYQNFLT